MSASLASAATRAEYVAQVDPICLSSNEQTRKDAKRYGKKVKDFFKGLKDARGSKGIKKELDKLLDLTVRFLRRDNSRFSRTTLQIAAVSPAPGDEAAVSAWLQGRSEYARLSGLGLRALKNGKNKRSLVLETQAIDALVKGQEPVGGFGFSHCLVRIELPPIGVK